MKEMKHATENIYSRVKQMEDKINDLEGRNFEITYYATVGKLEWLQ